MEDGIATDVTSERLRRVINGYKKNSDPERPVDGLGGGFRYCRLGIPLFNEYGDIDRSVTFSDLAAHVFFSETGVPIPRRAAKEHALLGTHGEKAVYLLFSQSDMGAPRSASGNVLTLDALAALTPPQVGFEGVRVVYAEACTVAAERLRHEGIVFKQIPYQVAAG